MKCPKCKAKVGIMNKQIILDTGVVNCSGCVICGYLAIDPPMKRAHAAANRAQRSAG